MKTALLLLEESDAKQAELGCIYAITGFIDKAKVIAADIEEHAEKRQYTAFTKYSIAALYACLKEEEKAIAWLMQSYEEKSYRMIYLKTDPWFKSLLSNPVIEKFIYDIGL